MANCYSCVYRQNITGSVHSACGAFNNAPALGLEMLVAVTSHDIDWFKDMIEIDLHGLKNGWANYPIDFDPIWIKKCVFYKQCQS